MIILKYENEMGSLTFGSGNASPYKLKSIEGLSFIPKQYTINEYANIPGQTVTGGIEPARTITVSLDVKTCDVFTMVNFNKVLSEPGELHINVGGVRRRKIKCRCTDFVPEGRRKIYQPMVIQFVCDYPFFEDAQNQKLALFSRENLIQNTFTLPCVFTKRVSRVNIVNHGQRDTEPVIFIVCTSVADSTKEGKITLINHTSNVAFTLDYSMNAGEEIIIDFAKRTITSNILTDDNNNGNLLPYMSEDSFLSKFKLIPGTNDIECLNGDVGREISAICEFSSKYIEAVY